MGALIFIPLKNGQQPPGPPPSTAGQHTPSQQSGRKGCSVWHSVAIELQIEAPKMIAKVKATPAFMLECFGLRMIRGSIKQEYLRANDNYEA